MLRSVGETLFTGGYWVPEAHQMLPISPPDFMLDIWLLFSKHVLNKRLTDYFIDQEFYEMF